jgi:cell division protein FtsI/penicillin-binding protein 2
VSLERVASAFGFAQNIPFDAALEPSALEIPTETLEFARASAGFWHSSLSPLHGALIAAAVANGGVMPAPRLIEKAVGPDGAVLDLPRRRARRVIDADTAREVGRMMELTTTIGTARATFRSRRGVRFLPVEVAGKTGSLSYRGAPGDPVLPAANLVADGGYLGYSWFVGYAPTDRPRVAFAVVLGNRATWRIKAPYVARRLVTEYLAAGGDARASRMLAAR